MKKIFGIFILSFFLLSSLSIAFAEESRGYGVRNTLEERQQSIQERQVQREAKLDERLTKIEEKRQELRKKMQERLDAAKTRKDEIKDAADVLKIQCRLKCGADTKCITDQPMTGNCGEAFTKIKEHLTKTVDRMIEAFTALKTRLATADATQTEQLTKIDAALTELQSLKTQIDAAKTREELKKVMTQVRETWVKYKQLFKEKKADAYQQRAASMLKKAERIQTLLQQALTRIKASDATAEQVSLIETSLKAIDAQIVVVRTALTQEDKNVVKDSLQKLHDLLQEAIKSFRQSGKGDAIATVTTTEPAPVAGVTP
ncbi:hypothetical protein J4208_00245 [Candidatus Woesearchaeota archaeon]|nr:hypothetical protein [Candidatus Woesearchaeota archaeon]